jgi:hypothetical protein
MDAMRPARTESKKNDPGHTDPRGDSRHIAFPDLETMNLAFEAGKIGVWTWDIASDKVAWSANLDEIHRLPTGSFDGTLSFFVQDIHPDDRAVVIAAV